MDASQTTLADWLEMVVGCTLAVIEFCRAFRLPPLDVVSALFQRRTSLHERAGAMRILATGIARALTIAFCVAVLWRLGYLLTVVLWPIALPLKLVQRLAAGHPS